MSAYITCKIKSPVIKVHSKSSCDSCEFKGIWPGQYSETDVHCLQILGPGRRSDSPWGGSNVVYDGLVEPRHFEIQTWDHRSRIKLLRIRNSS